MRVIVQGLRALLIAVSCSKSLLRVTSGHRECRWPLRIKQTFWRFITMSALPQKWTFDTAIAMSALCQKRTGVSSHRSAVQAATIPQQCNVRIPRMRWVHRSRRHGAYLALLALALQIVLSFGHVDLSGIIGPTHLTLAGKQNTVGAQAQPGPVKTSGDGDSYCPICASIFLVSNSFVSEPPKIPVPDGFERTIHSIRIDRGTSTPRSIVFRSRAPPAA
jgi:hypothetical protein